MGSVNLKAIEKARESLNGVAKKTELDHSRTFSQMSGNEVYLKLENLQRTGSFKIRGAYNKIISLSEDEKTNGVVAASAGNHAQGVALGAAKAGIDSTIVMPEGAPISKVKATREYGAKVVLSGETYDEAHKKEEEISEETGATIIPAFNDPKIIAGQGTIGLEILDDLSDLEAVVVPIGGGGLISGIATAIKENSPETEVIGVEASGAASMTKSLEQGSLSTLKKIDTMADGIAVKTPGNLTYSIVSDYVDHIVTVDDEEIAYAILLLLERAKLTVEGAGAVGLAALLNDKVPLHGKKTAVVLSGGNIDLNMISKIIDRGLVKAGRRKVICTRLRDTPGSLERLLSVISDKNANVVSVNHDRLKPEVSLSQAEVEVVLETRDQEHINEVISALKDRGYYIKEVR